MPELRPETNWTLYLDDMVEEAKLAERLGFTEYWVGEHHTAGHETVPDPLMMLARIAEATDTIRLGPATVNLTYDIHDPFHVAEGLAFLDQLSHGRAMYGYGAGALPRDMEMFGVDFERQKDIMWEAIDVIETYLDAEEPTDSDGEFFQYEDRMIQLPALQESPQSAVAGLSSGVPLTVRSPTSRICPKSTRRRSAPTPICRRRGGSSPTTRRCWLSGRTI
jgi:limonene 1,2-monooxygenase